MMTHDRLTELLKEVNTRRAKARELIEHLQQQSVEAQRQALALDGQYLLLAQMLRESIQNGTSVDNESCEAAPAAG